MADATDLKSVVRKGVRVRLPPSAPIISTIYSQSIFERWTSATELTPLRVIFWLKSLGKIALRRTQAAPIT